MSEAVTETPAEGELGTSDHDKEMMEKADNSSLDQEIAKKTLEEAAKKDPARPEWLPEKYKTVDEFLKGHQELEKIQHPPKAQAHH